MLGSCALHLANLLCQEESRPESSRTVGFEDLLIRTKDKRLVPFTPNLVQRKYLAQLAPNWQLADYRLRIGAGEMILKARQFGFSTLIGALFFIDTITTPNTTTVVVAHDKDTTELLFRMVQIFYDNLAPSKRPRAKYASKREFYWPDLNSSYYVGTAGAKEFGRSQTINNLHCSEVAFYSDAETLMTGLLNAVPSGGNVFLETTANGVGDWYHSEFLLAEQGLNGYQARFFAWFEHDEYRLDPTLAPSPTSQDIEAETRLRKLYGLDEWQLAWRRAKLRQPGMRRKFQQEYPANAREAFLSSGTPFFDMARLQEIEGDLTEPKAIEIPEEFRRLRRALQDGQLEVYEAPKAGRFYAIGADAAEGLASNGVADFSSADVLDAATWTQVCHLHGDWDPGEFGRVLDELGRWYNTALIIPERNNHGHAVIVSLQGCDYPDQESDEIFGLYCHQEYDQQLKTHLRRPGWPTTTKTRPILLQALDDAVDAGDIWIRSKGTVSEMTSFVKLPGGKSGAQEGCHDDRVMSLALAVAVLKLLPPPRPPIVLRLS